MRLRNALLGASAWLLTLWLVPLLSAQVYIPQDAVPAVAEIDQKLRDGQSLEQQRRWGEALSHYEKLLKEHPQHREIRERHSVARLHFDVTRRYADGSFLQATREMGEREALDQYSEVLLKVHTHYVDNPNWNEILRHGTQSLDAALAESVFLQNNLPVVAPERLDAFRRQLQQTLGQRVARTRHEARDIVAYAARFAQQNLGLPVQVAILEYTCGAVNSLDDYSTYLTVDQLNDAFSQIEGNFVGLGIELKAENQALSVVNVIPGSPAEKGGIRPGDRIIEVDGRSTKDVSTDSAADMLKGQEGTTVEVAIVTQQNSTHRLRIRRQMVEVPSVEKAQILDGTSGVGYFRLASFQKTTTRDVDQTLWNLHRQGMKSLIMDLRGNPGGLLTASVEIADRFLTTGFIVSTRGRSPREDQDYRAVAPGTWNVPLVVLIDGDSASASEILAGALHDQRRATIVGARSYGKGSVQGIFPLGVTKAGVRLTTAKFFSPNGTPISGNGVSPDVTVQVVNKPAPGGATLNPANDPVLSAALQVARDRLSQR